MEELSASALRNLLIEEVKKIIISLDHRSIEELVQIKGRLREIFDLIADKERQEGLPLAWGKNSIQPSKDTIVEYSPLFIDQKDKLPLKRMKRESVELHSS